MKLHVRIFIYLSPRMDFRCIFEIFCETIGDNSISCLGTSNISFFDMGKDGTRHQTLNGSKHAFISTKSFFRLNATVRETFTEMPRTTFHDHQLFQNTW